MIVPATVFEILCDGCQWEFSAPRAQDHWCVEELVDLEYLLKVNGWARDRAGQRHWCRDCVERGMAVTGTSEWPDALLAAQAAAGAESP